MTPDIETIYNLVCKHFPNDDNFQRFYREFSKYLEGKKDDKMIKISKLNEKYKLLKACVEQLKQLTPPPEPRGFDLVKAIEEYMEKKNGN